MRYSDNARTSTEGADDARREGAASPPAQYLLHRHPPDHRGTIAALPTRDQRPLETYHRVSTLR